MRILVCVSEYPPHASGTGNVAYRMVKQFEAKGHTCTICSPTGPDIRLGSHKMVQRFGGLGLLYFWHRVSRYFRGSTSQWDTVWLHWPLFLTACPFPQAAITFHGTYRGFRRMAQELRSPPHIKAYYAAMDRIEKHCLGCINSGGHRFTAVSPHIASELGSQGITQTITYVPVGVDTRAFHPGLNRAEVRATLGIAANALVLLFVGRLSQPKNLFALVDTFGQLKRSLPEAVLLLVGSGELESQLSRYIQRKGASGVRMLGFVPNEELPQIYACADFFVMSSKYEGQPVALLEAMAAGLPPIVSDIPVMRQLVEESGAGIVVDFDDPIQAAAQIGDYVLSDKAKQDRATIRAYVKTEMSSAICAERYLDLLNEVASPV